MTTATTVEVVHAFMEISHDHVTGHNWDTGPQEFRGEWRVNDDTYINGCLLIIDMDYLMGYLIEVVERSTSVVSYIAIAMFHGRDEHGNQQHDFITYPFDCGTFGDRTEAADYVTVSMWAVPRIFGMIEGYQERQRAR